MRQRTLPWMLAVVVGGMALARSPAAQSDSSRPTSRRLDVELTYVTSDPREALPVRTVGFYLGLEHRLKLERVDKADTCDGGFAYSGHSVRFRVEAAASKTPRVRLDLSGTDKKLEWNDVPLLADAQYVYRSDGYLQALLPPLRAEWKRRVFRLICVTRPDRDAYGFIEDRGVWKGSLKLGDRTLGVYVYDRQADGDLSNDELMLDLDRDGNVLRVAQVKSGMTVLLGEHALTFHAPEHGSTTARVEVATRDSAPDARDLEEEIAKAPIAGNVVPPFEFRDQRGKLVSSRALRGKVLLINFWGVW